ncbi:MAG: hypothetical protein P9X24_19000 [Candidatus Hatepunaea meridiana]|nr:hypothetical protein [Candidatus Hatepunaea meridiana]
MIYINNRNLMGVFGGISLIINSNLNVMIDYDTEKVNIGAGYCLFKRFDLIVALLDFQAIAGGLSYKYQL